MIESLQSLHPLETGAITLAAAFASTWLHEIGHAIAGRLAGFRITSVGTGFGRPLLRLRIRDTVFFMSLSRPFQGITTSVRDSWPTPRGAKAALLAGGVSANLLTAGAAIGLFFALGRDPRIFLVAAVNMVFCALSMLPVSISLPGAMLRSDASQILGLFGRRRPQLARMTRIQDSERFVRFLSAIRDRFGEYHYRIHLASALSEIGNEARALSVLEEVDDSLYPLESHMGALLRVVRGSARFAEGMEEEATSDLKAADAAFTALNAPGLAGHLCVLKAEKAVGTGDFAAALEALAEDDESPHSSSHRLAAARSLHALGRHEEAVSELGEIGNFEGENRLVALEIYAASLSSAGGSEEAGSAFEEASALLLANFIAVSPGPDRDAYLLKHQWFVDAYPEWLRSRGDGEGAEEFLTQLHEKAGRATSPSAFLTLSGLFGVLCAAGAVFFAARGMWQVASGRSEMAPLRWAGILAAIALYLGISGVLNRRIRKALPASAAIVGALCLLVLGVFFGTLVITHRKAFRETLEYDRNGDQKVDRKLTMENGLRVYEEIDTDFDGKTNLWIEYENGEKFRVLGDDDGDGDVDWMWEKDEGSAGRNPGSANK